MGFDGSLEYKEKLQGFLANLPTLLKYINSNFDGLSFKGRARPIFNR